MIEEYLTPGGITLFISIAGILSFYLGKVVLDFYPSKENKSLNYIIGFILFLIYIIIPLLFFYYFPNLKLNLTIVGFLLFWLIYSLLYFYLYIKMKIFEIIRNKKDSYFYEVCLRNIKKFGIDLKTKTKLNQFFKKFFMTLPNQIFVLIIGYLTIFISINIFLFFDNWIVRIFILICLLPTLNKIIVLHTAKTIKYNEVKIIDLNEKKFTGRLIKQDEEYIHLNSGDKFYNFPKANIKRVETDIKINLEKQERLIDKFTNLFENLTFLKKSKKEDSQQ